jgi:ADP-ribose pyrophosphatase
MCVNTNFSPEPSVRRELIHRGVKFDFERLTLTGNSGGTLSRECIRHPGSVIVAPLLMRPGPSGVPEWHLVLIRNWRLATERWMLELPAGTMTPGEDPKLCAARELEEETGFRAGTLSHLLSFHTAPGLTDEFMHAYVARDLVASAQDLEEDERIQVVPTPLASVPSLLEGGEITDAKTLLLLHVLWRTLPEFDSARGSCPAAPR